MSLDDSMDRLISDNTPALGEDVLQALFEDALGVPGHPGAPASGNWAWRLFSFTARLAKTKQPAYTSLAMVGSLVRRSCGAISTRFAEGERMRGATATEASAARPASRRARP